MGTIKVLHIIDGLNNGGAESYIKNSYQYIDKNRIQFDFLTKGISQNQMLLKELKEHQSHIYKVSSYPQHPLKNALEVYRFLTRHPEYQIVHIHANSFVYITPLLLAYLKKKPCIIWHSHNTKTGKFPAAKWLHYINRLLFADLPTQRFACSAVAGEWMFGKKSFHIINNGIDLQSFAYQDSVRKRLQNEFQLDQQLVIGHIGRFVTQKNHRFLIDIFYALYNIYPASKLILIGDGPLKEQILTYVKKLGIQNQVLFMGTRNDVNDLLNVMDIFVFPSLFEGLPITLIEAQANDLPCIISENISDEVCLTKCVRKMSLDASPEQWAQTLLSIYKQNYIRSQKPIQTLADKGYSAQELGKWMEQFYISAYEEK